MNEDPNSSSSQPDVSPVETPASTSSSTGLAPNVAAGLCAVFPLLGGIVFLVLEKSSPFVKFWALQSIYFGVAALVASVAVSVIITVLAFIPILGWLIGALLWIAVTLSVLAFWVIGIVNAFQGKHWKMPVLGNMVEKQTAKAPNA